MAREKLGLISREKQLQLERRKRAMAFLNQIKGAPAATKTIQSTTIHENTLPSIEKGTNELEDDNGSVQSVQSSAHSEDIKDMKNANEEYEPIAKREKRSRSRSR